MPSLLKRCLVQSQPLKTIALCHHNTTPALTVPIDLVQACILSQPLVQALPTQCPPEKFDYRYYRFSLVPCLLRLKCACVRINIFIIYVCDIALRLLCHSTFFGFCFHFCFLFSLKWKASKNRCLSSEFGLNLGVV